MEEGGVDAAFLSVLPVGGNVFVGVSLNRQARGEEAKICTASAPISFALPATFARPPAEETCAPIFMWTASLAGSAHPDCMALTEALPDFPALRQRRSCTESIDRVDVRVERTHVNDSPDYEGRGTDGAGVSTRHNSRPDTGSRPYTRRSSLPT